MSENARPSHVKRISTFDGGKDPYDHEIQQFDTTRPGEVAQGRTSRPEDRGWRDLARNVTKTSVRDSMNRRKYAKWSAERFGGKDGGESAPEEAAAEDVDSEPERSSSIQPESQQEGQPRDSRVLDFATGQPQGEESQTDTASQVKPKKSSRTERREQESVIDILYENQRGWFFCGIPLYSHSSLLQFDPAAWVTKDYKDSAVNITNAQVPDPSWQWEWKHWYVDMTDDVDEDGWQYSFAFFGNFAWHGTHPWFHSYVRRRRWLRKRVRRDTKDPTKTMPSSMSAAHKLNTDYFTIHSQPRASSPGRTLDSWPQTARPDSYISQRSHLTLDDEIPEEIDDISSLLKAMRLSTIDRQRLDATKKFVETGNEELVYLEKYIPEIMSLLVYQNSKRRLLEFLRQKAKEAQEHRDEHDAQDGPEGDSETRRINSLLKAADAADEEVRGLEYYSDRKHVLKVTDDKQTLLQTPLQTIFDRPAPSPRLEPNPAGEIKGISDEAGIGVEGAVIQRRQNAPKATPVESKGKEKEEMDGTGNGTAAEETHQLTRDEVFIPDE